MQRMQKALTQMNLQLANVISDISGLTGQAILRAITAGERDAGKLAELRDPRIKASPEEIAKSLQGDWRPELLFVLQQEVEMYDAYQQRITECDRQLQKHLAQFSENLPPAPSQAEPRGKKAKPAKNAPRFDLNSELQRITGVDLTRIDGIDVMVAQTILSEVGFDMTRWKTEAHFASWLGLCPDNQISGDKVLGRGTRWVVSRVATALRIWDKPASACLSSRIEYGRPVTPEALQVVEQGEDALRQMGFRQFRVRHHGDIVRIEIAPEELPRALGPEMATEFTRIFKALGFSYVTLDLEGFRSGSMNAVLPIDVLTKS